MAEQYTTLERPNLHFDSAGRPTHLVLAADLTTGPSSPSSLALLNPHTSIMVHAIAAARALLKEQPVSRGRRKAA